MKRLIISFSALIFMSGCSYFPEEVLTGGDECMYIGCETGGLIIYPHERPEDKNEPGENYEL
ncbi:MAG: hypothetical protein RI539_05510 [Spiribacter sp.]|jgi:hypothetical protein|nr:hypothetical protein [Spiribacter sp.]